MRLAKACVVPAVAAVLAGVSCSRTYDNPFAGSHMTVEPPATARIVFTSNFHAARAGGGREIFAVDDTGANPTRLTFCTQEGAACSSLEASFGTDRRRAMVRRVSNDTNTDGRLTAADGEALVLVDFSRSVEGQLLPATARVSSVDWSQVADVVVFSATGNSSVEDLFRVDPNGQNSRNLTDTGTARERHPRVDPTGSIATYERIEGNGAGKAEVWIFFTTQAQSRITSGGAPGPALPGTPYLVGSDADPDFGPSGRTLVFRRLTGLGERGLGNWDLMTVATDGTALTSIASGPAFRDAPDWGPNGIVFTETAADGHSEVVIVDADGSNRRTVLTVGAGFELGAARWLP
jgi:Tol biopolymer transport system component